jgi:hypothetical protein
MDILLTIPILILCLSLTAVGILFVSILQGAGRPIGEAGLMQAAPWFARILPNFSLRLILIGRPEVMRDMEAELEALVDHLFQGKYSATERAGAMLSVLRESIGMMRRAAVIRRVPRVADSAVAGDFTVDKLMSELMRTTQILEEAHGSGFEITSMDFEQEITYVHVSSLEKDPWIVRLSFAEDGSFIVAEDAAIPDALPE